MDDLFATLRPSIGVILRSWTEASAAETTGSASRGSAIDVLSSALLDLAAASTESIAEAERACEGVATAYGRELCVDRHAEQLLFEECDLIRRAVWHYVQRQEPDDDLAAEAIAHLDAAITLATVAALRGYHGGGDRATP